MSRSSAVGAASAGIISGIITAAPVHAAGEDPVTATIEQIQGAGTESPLKDKEVTTSGVVTAAYPEGRFNGIYLQTAGSGGTVGDGSSAVFVFDSAIAQGVQIGDAVTVTGMVSEYNGLTEVTANSFEVNPNPQPAVKATPVRFPITEKQREALEGMLLEPQGTYTITNNYSTNQYGEIGLAPGKKPLHQPTNEARPGSTEYDQLVADNADSLIMIDDGASTNFFNSNNQGIAVPWLTADNEVRVGSQTQFTSPVVLDFRFGWKLQPLSRLTADNAGDVRPVADFSSTRKPAPNGVGGDLRIASFNVLNYFTTLGEGYAADGHSCTYYKDRAGANITDRDCGPTGPRGAANTVNLQRQQAKIVSAINGLTADVVSLEEIENSLVFGKHRDDALSKLVEALNADAGSGTWDYVRSPAALPNHQDVIRTAFIYRTKTAQTIGTSHILDDPAFANARQPLAQGFVPVNGDPDDTFLAIVNHFKSKGSGTGDDADQGDGQGSSNHSRVLQATALVKFAADQAAALGTEKVFLLGDFNAYTEEDPMVVLGDAGYVDIGRTRSDKETYQYDGLIGSLDHVMASPAAAKIVTGADVWNINAYESVAREYSRYNYNVTDFYNTSAFRSSDHDPVVVGLAKSTPALAQTSTHAYSSFFGIAVAVTGGRNLVDGSVTLYDGEHKLATTGLSHGLAYFGPWQYSRNAKDLRVVYSGSKKYAPSEGKVRRLF